MAEGTVTDKKATTPATGESSILNKPQSNSSQEPTKAKPPAESSTLKPEKAESKPKDSDATGTPSLEKIETELKSALGEPNKTT